MIDYDLQEHPGLNPHKETGPNTTGQGTPPSQPPQEKREGLKSIISTVTILLVAPLVALFLTAFVFQSYQVDGPSMQTTLYNNDRLLVWKVPRTWARITGNSYTPNRGDVVIFAQRDVMSFSEESSKQLIKRVIALPGEQLVIKDGNVTVFNKEHPEGFNPDKTLPYGTVIKETTHDWEGTIPKNEIFVMGDNRAESLDSRFFGPVSTDDIVGKLVMRVWPLNQTKLF